MPSTPGRPQSRLWRALAPAVFGLAGLLFATSFQAARGTDLRSDRGLPGLIDTANRDVAAKSSTIEKLQNELDALTAAAAPSDGRIVPLTGTINLLAPHVGTRAVQGPALTVALTDSNRSMANLPPSIRPDDLVVHQQDVQAVVNALWRGGAEAMMIQDQRVIATSAVRCVGNTLILQGRVYSPPFVVIGVGDQADMERELARDDYLRGFQAAVEFFGLGYEQVRLDQVTLPGYDGPLNIDSATPLPEKETRS